MEKRQPHYFLALSIPREVKECLNKVSEQIMERYTFNKWVHKEDLHITLAFLGTSSQEQYEPCMRELKVLLRNTSTFPLQLSHFGTFGLREKPRIFWCGPDVQEKLLSLQRIVTSCCKANGFQLDDKLFNPHITMARKYEGNTLFTKTDLEKCDNLLKDGIQFTASTVSLFETHMDEIPKYKTLDSIKLAPYVSG